MIMIRTALVCIGTLLSLQCYSQDLPLGAWPMMRNGGFAGEGGQPRLNAGVLISHYNNILGTHSYTHFISYDQFIPKIRSGIGLSVMGLNFTGTGSYANMVMLSYSPKFSLRGKYTIAPFVDFAYHQANLEYNSSTERSQIYSGRIGALFNSSKYYIGLTSALFNYYESPRLNLILQAGYTFQRSPESKFSFTPQLTLGFTQAKDQPKKYRNNLSIPDINLMFRYKKFLWSINNNGLGLGYQTNNLRVMLSQNLIVPGIGHSKASLTARYIFKKKS